MDMPILTDLMIIFGVSTLSLILASRFKVPPVVAYFIAGFLVGPNALGLVHGGHEVHILAEIGVILLLFAIGLEFSIKTLMSMRRAALAGGALQVGLTTVTVMFAFMGLGYTTKASLLFGLMTSLSSTAVVLRVLATRGESDTPHGRNTFGILIFQDVAAVIFILAVPLFAAGQAESAEAGLSAGALLLDALIFFATVVGAWKFTPRLLLAAARTKNREVFLLSVFSIVIAVAWLISLSGLSLALGAFVAGLIISESEYGHQAFGAMIPFRDVFMSFFFVSIGMLIDPFVILHHPIVVPGLVLFVFIVKGFAGSFAIALVGYPLRTALLTGINLAQVGEFSFIMASAALAANAVPESVYGIIVTITVLSMALTPFAIMAGPRIIALHEKLPLPNIAWLGRFNQQASPVEHIKDHVIIVGFGINGSNLAKACERTNIPYVVIEMNADTVRNQKAAGRNFIYGDGCNEAVLDHAGIKRARVMAVAIPDAAATRQITELGRTINRRLYIIARTRFVQEVEPLLEIGATEVIPEEFETSIAIFSRVLSSYLVPKKDIDELVRSARDKSYGFLRGDTDTSMPGVDLQGVEIGAYRIEKDSAAAGKSIGELDLRNEFGVTVLAHRREGRQDITGPGADTYLRAGDVVVVMAPRDANSSFADLFSHPKDSGKR